MRLKVIAAVRAPTIAATTQKKTRNEGTPRPAKNAPIRANGSAKTLCLNWIISSMMPIFFSMIQRLAKVLQLSISPLRKPV